MSLKVKRVLDVAVDPAHIKSVDAAIILCIDPRWWKKQVNGSSAVEAFVRAMGWESYVPLTEAGGFKVLVSDDPMDASRRATLLERIDEEIHLHDPKELAFSLHRDCGKYGYLAAFGGDTTKETERLHDDIRKARTLLAERYPARKIAFYIFDVEGVEQVDFQAD